MLPICCLQYHWRLSSHCYGNKRSLLGKDVIKVDFNQINDFIMVNLQYILLGMTAIIFIALLIFININLKLSKMNRRYQKLMQGVEGANLERLLHAHIEEVREVVGQVNTLSNQCKEINIMCNNSLQNVGVVRFNAFDDTGSDLSFAIALLDGHRNGLVVSSLFGRSESRVYAKPIVNGQSTYLLTTEEKEAISKAVSSKERN